MVELVLQKAQRVKKREYLFETYQMSFSAQTDHVSATFSIQVPVDGGLGVAEENARRQLQAFAHQLATGGQSEFPKI